MLKDLSPDERKSMILQRINESGRVLANAVASEFGVSEDSIRRDLRELSEQGLVQRFHGGAARSRSGPRSFQQRARDETAGKKAVAVACAARIPMNTTMLLDSSTTVLEFVRALPRDLQVCIITGSPDIASAALDHPCCEVILLGGSLNRLTRSAIGQSTLAEVQSMRVDYCVLGACAVDEELMLRAENYDDARMKLALGQACNEIILLATSEKLVKQAPFAIGPVSLVSTLITDRTADRSILERISRAGVEVIVADDQLGVTGMSSQYQRATGDDPMDASVYLRKAVYGRWAVACAFFFNGFLVGSWAPQIPVFMVRLGISEFTLGLLILVFGIGALAAMPWCGYLISRFGSRAVVKGFAIFCSFSLLLVALAPNVSTAAPALFLFGAVIGGMDVAMNANAVEVEKKLSRAVMSSSHGFWSLGGFAGGALGGLVIEAHGHLAHALVVTLIAILLGIVAFGYMITEDAPVAQEKHKLEFPTNPLIYLIGLMALFSMVPEGSVLDWAALYLQQERGADIATAGFAFAAFSGTMSIMRFLGDGVRNRFGAVKTLRYSALIGATGMLIASVAPNSWIAILAFAFAGLGIANMVPIAFSAAGNQKGTSSGVALSMVTLMGYSGILVAPSAIGFVGGRTGFGPVYMVLAGLLIVVFLMSNLAKSADVDRS